jgi:putative toxin-antitoxin system antitoxin component (TIGR02293 family)
LADRIGHLAEQDSRMGKSRINPIRTSSLGLKIQSAAGMIEQINAGFPFKLLDHFARSVELPMEAVAAVVQIPMRTLSRRRIEGRLQPVESERLLRVSTLFEKAVALFEGDKRAALNWLQSPQPGLGGYRPFDFAKTEIGARAVEDLIGRLEHGVFS